MIISSIITTEAQAQTIIMVSRISHQDRILTLIHRIIREVIIQAASIPISSIRTTALIRMQTVTVTITASITDMEADTTTAAVTITEAITIISLHQGRLITTLIRARLLRLWLWVS